MNAVESTFVDPDQAIGYLREAFLMDGLLASEAHLYICGTAHGSHTGTVDSLLRVMRKRVQHFNRIHVLYRPENPYAYVARITCRCSDRERHLCQHPCQSEQDRPRVALVLRHLGEHEVMLGSSFLVPRPGPGSREGAG